MPKKSVAPTPPPIAEPDPVIMITPADGGYLINAYGMAPGEIANALRLALLTVVAKTSAVSFVERVVREPRPAWVPRVVQSPAPSANGANHAEPSTRRRRRLPVEHSFDADDLAD